MPKTFVVTQTYQHFKAFCMDEGISKHSPDVIHIGTGFPDSYKRLRGIRFEPDDRVIFYHTWYDGKYANDVAREIAMTAQKSTYAPVILHV